MNVLSIELNAGNRSEGAELQSSRLHPPGVHTTQAMASVQTISICSVNDTSFVNNSCEAVTAMELSDSGEHCEEEAGSQLGDCETAADLAEGADRVEHWGTRDPNKGGGEEERERQGKHSSPPLYSFSSPLSIS